MINGSTDAHAGERLIDIAGMRTRGWAPRLIRESLRDPDDYDRPPGQRSGRPKGLFSITRVERIENDEQFQAERERAAAFYGRLRGTQDKKQKNLIAVVDAIALPTLVEPLEDLLEAARMMQNFCAERRLLSASGLRSTCCPLNWPHSHGSLTCTKAMRGSGAPAFCSLRK